MESYQSDVKEFINCRNNEAQEAASAAFSEAEDDGKKAANEYSDVVDSFNRRAEQ